MDAVEPLFSIRMGIPPHRLEDLSLLQIIDHLTYWLEAGSDGD